MNVTIQRFIFPLGLFLSASLLFVIQPMIAKILLPTFGGAPAVWTVCLFFFQTMLLCAYGYVWILTRIQKTSTWRMIHVLICLLSLCTFPLAFVPVTHDGNPELCILLSLICQLGLPLFVIGASAPLLQHAFSQTKGDKASDPYFLYTASNVGSLLALFSYPYVIERFWGIHQQIYGWNVGYVIYLFLLVTLLLTVKFDPPKHVHIKHTIPYPRCFFWVFQSFVACGLMLAVTFYISTDIAATPLFWVLPLALYLLSFIVTFANKPLISHAFVTRYSLVFITILILGFILASHHIPAYLLILANLVGLFAQALLCHGELVRTRPASNQLALFYFCMSLGGVLAGLFNGLLAPHLFSHAYEYPLLIVLSLFCLPYGKKKYLIGFFVANLFAFIVTPWMKTTQILSQQRNFYGIKQVKSVQGAHILMSQNTAHGFQIPSEGKPTNSARAYYASVLPVIQRLQSTKPSIQAMVLGLGTGIMACQFRAQDALSMVEIDEQVIAIATNPHLFTYLRDCPPKTTVLKNDGRLAVEGINNASLDVLVIDTFLSDAIPVHLVTLEAFKLYQQKIKPEGIILANITNRHLRMLPVLTAAGREIDMMVLQNLHPGNTKLGQLPSEWVLLTTNESLANYVMSHNGWRFVADSESRLWTNDYSNLIPLIKFGMNV